MKESNIWKRVEVTGFCWHWTGSIDRDGYGHLSHGGLSTARAHRVVYELLVGLIPEGLTLDHLCYVRHCVNPDHLEPVTLEENHARRKELKNKGKKGHTQEIPLPRLECKHGHTLSEVGVLRSVRPNGSIRERCRACQHETQARNRRNKGLPERGRRGAYGPRVKEPIWEVEANTSKVG